MEIEARKLNGHASSRFLQAAPTVSSFQVAIRTLPLKAKAGLRHFPWSACRSLAMPKSTCPISRADFRGQAKPVEVVINGVPLMAEVKEFSTGSLGWYLNAKATVRVGEQPVTVQIGMNMTIVGSKELPQG
jgi:hypothetical protein